MADTKSRFKDRIDMALVGAFIAAIGFVALGTYVTPKAVLMIDTPGVVGAIPQDDWMKMGVSVAVFLALGIIGTVIYSRHQND